MKTNTRVALVRLACLCLSCYLAWPLMDIAPPRKPLELKKPARTEGVRLRAPARKIVEVKREQVIIRSVVAPKKKITAKKIAKVDAELPPVKEPIIELPQSPTLPMPAIPQLVFTQPALPNDMPPAPPDDIPRPAHFTDKPGGTVVVLAVQLNSDNEVVMTDILVESGTPFNDLAFALSTRGVKWKDVDPPIPPGEYRWVEIRFDYASPDVNKSVLP